MGVPSTACSLLLALVGPGPRQAAQSPASSHSVPSAYGTLTVRSLLDTREHCLNEFNFPDPYSKVSTACPLPTPWQAAAMDLASLCALLGTFDFI